MTQANPSDYSTQDSGRHVSRLARDTLALVLAGGQGSRLYELTTWRAKPSVYFGGKFRIIDFPLSNCINSGIRRIGVLTQYKAHSLIRHLVAGWTSSLPHGREFLEILPASQRVGGDWYQGTADAIYQNLDIIRTHSPKQVLILAGDHIYKMDYGPLLAQHESHRADMTVSCLEVPIEEAANTLGVIVVNDEGRVIGFEEKPEKPTPIPGQTEMCLASMGNYLFDTDFLYNAVIRDADDPNSQRDFGRNIIPSIIDEHKVFAYRFNDPSTGKQAYWRDVGTLDSYWQANMELVSVTPDLDMYDQVWPVWTHQPQLPPAKFVFDDPDRSGRATDSMVSGGCVISGSQVTRSLLFSNCRVRSFSTVTDSLLLPDVEIGRNCRISKAIIDRGAIIDADTIIGEDHEADRARGFRVTDKGVTLVTPDMLGQDLHFTR